MKVAIVGSSKLTPEEEKEARNVITKLFSITSSHDTIITGDASGVDSLVYEIGTKMFEREVERLESKVKQWNGPGGFRERNLKIAQSAGLVYSIATQKKDESCYHHNPHNPMVPDHQRTGGCWVMKEAKKLNKPVRLFIV